MPTARLVQISAWSYSRYGDYAQCPLKARCKIIDRLPEPESRAGENGTRVHILAAAVTLGRMPALDRQTEKYRAEIERILKTRELPEELRTFTEEFQRMRRLKARAEEQWCFDRDWRPTDWFGRDAWLRIKVDCHWLDVTKKKNGLRDTVVHVRDHKTGKENADHALQRSLYGLGALLQYPDAARVVVEHWYLDPGKIGGPDSWERADVPGLKEEWLKRTKAMLSDTTFAPRPGQYCAWCAFSKAKKGPCPF